MRMSDKLRTNLDVPRDCSHHKKLLHCYSLLQSHHIWRKLNLQREGRGQVSEGSLSESYSVRYLKILQNPRTRSNHSFSSLSMIISKASYDTLFSCSLLRSTFIASSHSWSEDVLLSDYTRMYLIYLAHPYRIPLGRQDLRLQALMDASDIYTHYSDSLNILSPT